MRDSLRATALDFAYDGGSVAGYVSANLLVGAIGAKLFANRVRPLQIGLLILARMLLGGIDCSLLGSSARLRRLEPLGSARWQTIGPLARQRLPPCSPPTAWLAGFAWGWIACAMVDAVLPLSLLAGSALGGATVMLAYGLGTLSKLLAPEFGAASMSALSPTTALGRRLRAAAGAVVLFFLPSPTWHRPRDLRGRCHSAGLACVPVSCQRLTAVAGRRFLQSMQRVASRFAPGVAASAIGHDRS
jgi:hypothetical protein